MQNFMTVNAVSRYETWKTNKQTKTFVMYVFISKRIQKEEPL